MGSCISYGPSYMKLCYIPVNLVALVYDVSVSDCLIDYYYVCLYVSIIIIFYKVLLLETVVELNAWSDMV